MCKCVLLFAPVSKTPLTLQREAIPTITLHLITLQIELQLPQPDVGKILAQFCKGDDTPSFFSAN